MRLDPAFAPAPKCWRSMWCRSNTAVRARIGRSIRAVDDNVRSWALRAVLAGRHNQPRRIQLKTGEAVSIASLPAGDEVLTRQTRLEVRELPDNIGYIRLHDSLGDERLIGDFDAALARYQRTAGLILDLRDTPSGGNSTMARAILGDSVEPSGPIRNISCRSEERETGVRRSWLELVTPLKPFDAARGRARQPLDREYGGGARDWFRRRRGRRPCVGTPMARLLGATNRFDLPQSHAGSERSRRTVVSRRRHAARSIRCRRWA